MQLDRHQNALLLGFITVSLLLHLLLIYLLPELSLFPPPPAKEPVVVELLPTAPPQPREREMIPSLAQQTEEKRELPAKRLGSQDQHVKKEFAPKGDDLEDLMPGGKKLSPSPSTQLQQEVGRDEGASQKKGMPPNISKPDILSSEGPKRGASDAGDQPPKVTVPKPPPLPNIDSLLQLPQSTIAHLEEGLRKEIEGNSGLEGDSNLWRRKYRKEVEEGDAIWLDTAEDILFSFLRRLHIGLQNNWSVQENPGISEDVSGLILITFNRNGTIEEIKLLETTGFPPLDNAFIHAVKKGGPYGSLPRLFKQEKLRLLQPFTYVVEKGGLKIYHYDQFRN